MSLFRVTHALFHYSIVFLHDVIQSSTALSNRLWQISFAAIYPFHLYCQLNSGIRPVAHDATEVAQFISLQKVFTSRNIYHRVHANLNVNNPNQSWWSKSLLLYQIFSHSYQRRLIGVKTSSFQLPIFLFLVLLTIPPLCRLFPPLTPISIHPSLSSLSAYLSIPSASLHLLRREILSVYPSTVHPRPLRPKKT